MKNKLKESVTHSIVISKILTTVIIFLVILIIATQINV